MSSDKPENAGTNGDGSKFSGKTAPNDDLDAFQLMMQKQLLDLAVNQGDVENEDWLTSDEIRDYSQAKEKELESRWKDVLRDPEASLRALAEQEQLIKDLAAKKDWNKLLQMQQMVQEQLATVHYALQKTGKSLEQTRDEIA